MRFFFFPPPFVAPEFSLSVFSRSAYLFFFVQEVAPHPSAVFFPPSVIGEQIRSLFFALVVCDRKHFLLHDKFRPSPPVLLSVFLLVAAVLPGEVLTSFF